MDLLNLDRRPAARERHGAADSSADSGAMLKDFLERSLAILCGLTRQIKDKIQTNEKKKKKKKLFGNLNGAPSG